jgi:glycine/D-amino acid oxidase-like deaminating enzyme
MEDVAMQASDAPSDAILLRPELYRVATSNDHVEQLRQTAALYPQIAEWQDPEHTTNPMPFGATMDATTDDAPSQSSWIFTGLSSRGLLYHGSYGQLLSQAILQRDESLLLRHCPDILWWKNDDTEIG